MKKLITTFLAIVCVITSVCMLTACNDRTPYYNKTFTFTGEQSIDWNGKNFADNYGDLGVDVSQKQLIEKYWDKIDFSKTGISSATNADDLIKKIESAKTYAVLKDVSLSFTGKDELQLTITLPAEFASWGYGETVMMPFAETQSQLNAIKPQELNLTIYEEDLGYNGIGVKSIGDRTIVVTFSVSYVDVNLEITSYNNTDYAALNSITTHSLRPTLMDESGNTVIEIATRPIYNLTDNK